MEDTGIVFVHESSKAALNNHHAKLSIISGTSGPYLKNNGKSTLEVKYEGESDETPNTVSGLSPVVEV
jgi:hypothetical protein